MQRGGLNRLNLFYSYENHVKYIGKTYEIRIISVSGIVWWYPEK